MIESESSLPDLTAAVLNGQATVSRFNLTPEGQSTKLIFEKFDVPSARTFCRFFDSKLNTLSFAK
jgi:hypothetical protein